MGDQACQGILLPRSVDYVGIVRHHDRHLLHHFDPGSRLEERMKTKDEEEEEWWRWKMRGVQLTGSSLKVKEVTAARESLSLAPPTAGGRGGGREDSTTHLSVPP